MAGWGGAGATRGAVPAAVVGGGLQVDPLLGHGGEHLLEVATGEPGLNGPGERLHHPLQLVEGGMEVPPAREPPLLPRPSPSLEGHVRHKPLLGCQPPRGDGIEAGISKEVALGPYFCEGDKALPEPLEERPKLVLPYPFREPGPGAMGVLIARPLHGPPA